MSTLTVEALENIAKLARQRIDAGLRHHGEQWRLGGRTGINFMMEKLRRLATPQPLKGDGDVPVQELIDQLQDTCVTSDGMQLPDHAEPWGCDVGLLRKVIAALSALPQHPPVEPETNAQVAELDSVLRERGLPTVADALGYSRNYAEATPHLTRTGKDHILSLCTMLEIAVQHPPATRVQVVTLFGHPKRNLYHRPQGLSETVGGFDLRSREIVAAIEPFGVVNQKLTTEEDATVKESLTVAESTGGEAVAVVDFVEGSAVNSTQVTLRRPLPVAVALPPEGTYAIIQYGDLSVPAKLFAGDDALGSARFRLSQIAQECNAHLFVSIENLIGADHA